MPLDIAIVTPTYNRIAPILPGDSGTYIVTLEDGRTGSRQAPLTVIAYRGGMLLSGGSSGSGFNATGNLANGTAAADTDATTADGMPWEEKTKLGSFVENIGIWDGVARDGPLAPTPTLTALAAPGRNPAEILIATLTGGDGEGGGDSGSELTPVADDRDWFTKWLDGVVQYLTGAGEPPAVRQRTYSLTGGDRPPESGAARPEHETGVAPLAPG